MSKVLHIKNYTLSGSAPTICVPIVAKDDKSIIENIDRCIEAGVKLIEFRADFYENLFDSNKLLSLLKKMAEKCQDTIILFTIRTKSEGGEVDISEEDYRRILLEVSHCHHIDLLDCELDKVSEFSEFVRKIKSDGTIVVASHHNFSHTYDGEKIAAIYGRMLSGGADIQKIAMMPENKEDVFRLMSVSVEFGQAHEDSLLVAISMGQLGQITRICSGYINSAITFASIEKASAPGQISFSDMKDILSKINY